MFNFYASKSPTKHEANYAIIEEMIMEARLGMSPILGPRKDPKEIELPEELKELLVN